MTKQKKILLKAAFDDACSITPARILLLACMALLAIMVWSAQRSPAMASGKSMKKNAAPSAPVILDPQEAIRDLIQTHPHPEIRGELSTLILNHEVGLNFDDLARDVGAMATVVYGKMEGSDKETIALNFSLDHLFDAKTSRAFKQLVIYHEWIHIKQQRSKRYPDWLAKGRLPSTPEEVRTFFEAESEAYVEECALAVALDQTDVLDVCSMYKQDGKRAMRKALAEKYVSTPILSLYKTELLAISQE